MLLPAMIAAGCAVGSLNSLHIKRTELIRRPHCNQGRSGGAGYSPPDYPDFHLKTGRFRLIHFY